MMVQVYENTIMINKAKWHDPCYKMFSNREVERARSKQTLLSSPVPNTPVKKRLRLSSRGEEKAKISKCFFCDQKVDIKIDHCAETLTFNDNVTLMANTLQDRNLIGKLSEGDTIATEAIYHKKCYTTLYTRYRSFQRNHEAATKYLNISAESIAFAELVAYMEEFSEEVNTFKLSELVRMYSCRLEELGERKGRINNTRLKNNLMETIPNLEENKSSSGNIFLSVNLGNVLLTPKQKDEDKDAVILMRAAQIVRKEILEMNYKFNGSLVDDQYNELPSRLYMLNRMPLNGTSLPAECSTESNAAHTLTQLMTFNSIKRARNQKKSAETHHAPSRETSLPLYLGLLVHNKTRKRDFSRYFISARVKCIVR